METMISFSLRDHLAHILTATLSGYCHVHQMTSYTRHECIIWWSGMLSTCFKLPHNTCDWSINYIVLGKTWIFVFFPLTRLVWTIMIQHRDVSMCSTSTKTSLPPNRSKYQACESMFVWTIDTHGRMIVLNPLIVEWNSIKDKDHQAAN